jgi:hypothetical protein
MTLSPMTARRFEVDLGVTKGGVRLGGERDRTGGPRWETAIAGLGIGALALALLGWMLWPR